MTSYSKVVRHVDAYTETTRPSLDSIENGRLFLVETYYKDNFSTPTVLPAIIQGAGERRIIIYFGSRTSYDVLNTINHKHRFVRWLKPHEFVSIYGTG